MVTRSLRHVCVSIASFQGTHPILRARAYISWLQYLHKWQGLFPYFTAHFGDGVMRWSGLRKPEMSK